MYVISRQITSNSVNMVNACTFLPITTLYFTIIVIHVKSPDFASPVMYYLPHAADKIFEILTHTPDLIAFSLTRHVFEKHGCPQWQQIQNMAKISKS